MSLTFSTGNVAARSCSSARAAKSAACCSQSATNRRPASVRGCSERSLWSSLTAAQGTCAAGARSSASLGLRSQRSLRLDGLASATHDEVTVGIDIGTSSVKAVAADGDGNVVARARIPHSFRVPTPTRFEHDADARLARGPATGAGRPRRRRSRRSERRRDGAVAHGSRRRRVGPSTPGLLYGDDRGRHGSRPAATRPRAASCWRSCAGPRRRRPTHGATGRRRRWRTTRSAASPSSTRPPPPTAYPLFDWTGWDEALAAEVGVTTEQLPKLAPTGSRAAGVGGDGAALGARLHRRVRRAAGGRGRRRRRRPRACSARR